MKKLRKRINKIRKLVLLLKRRFYLLFHSTHPIFREKDYFLNLFQEKAYGYNIKALNFTSGIVLGSFQGKDYLMHCKPGNLIESTIYLKIWEEHLVRIMSLYLDGISGVVIDVGGNIGGNTIPLAVQYPQVKFYCYEPHPEIYARLKRNINLNNLKNISAENYAISNYKDKTVNFFAQKNSDNMGKSSLKHNADIKEHEKIIVPNIRLDDIFAESNDPVLIIKIDTQGTELEVLKSGEMTIEKFRPMILLEFEDRYYSNEERETTKIKLNEFFDNLNYSLFNISKGLNYYPLMDITKNYHGDILATPR